MMVVLLSPGALHAQRFHKVAERESIAPTGDRYYGFGVPSINEVAVLDGRYNLAVDHTMTSGGNYLGNGVLSFTGCQQDCATGNASVYLDPQAYELYMPSAQIASLDPAMLVGTTIPGHEIRSGNTGITGAPGIFFGRPSAENAKVVYYQLDNQLKPSLISYDVPTGVPTTFVDPTLNPIVDDFTELGMLSSVGSSDHGISVSGQRVVFRGHHSAKPAQNGIFTKVLTHNPGNGSVAPGPLEVVFSYGSALPAFESLPVAHRDGAAWSYSQTVSGKGEGVYWGKAHDPVTGAPHIETLAPRVSANDPFYGDVASGGFGPIMFEVIPAAGGPRRIGMSLHGTPPDRDYINTTDIPAGPGIIVENIDMGSQAVMAEANPLSLNTSGAKVAFFADQNTAGGGATHQLDAIYVADIPEFAIDFGGRFGADLVDSGRPAAEPQWFSIQGGGDGMQVPASDFVYMQGLDSSGQHHPLIQNYGVSLGVDSGIGEPSLLDPSEAVTIRGDYDIVIDLLTFTQLDVNESVLIGVDGSLTEYVYDGQGEDQYLDGMQGIPLPLLLPAGSTLTIENGGGGDGFGLSGVIARRRVLGDYDWDGELVVEDLDMLVEAVASGSFDLDFDLNGDAFVDYADVEQWLEIAGAANLASGNPYLVGDANLDGFVDGSDLAAWNSNKFTSVAAWSAGDFTADGTVDGFDYLIWRNNKFLSADTAGGIDMVPEPAGTLCGALGLLGWLCRRRRC